MSEELEQFVREDKAIIRATVIIRIEKARKSLYDTSIDVLGQPGWFNYQRKIDRALSQLKELQTEIENDKDLQP